MTQVSVSPYKPSSAAGCPAEECVEREGITNPPGNPNPAIQPHPRASCTVLRRAYSAPAQLQTSFDVPTMAAIRDPTAHVSPRKRILIFTVSAGGGHLAAAEAITQALSPSCFVFVEKPVETGVDAYNALLREGQNTWLGAITSLQDMAEHTLFPLMAAAPMGTAIDRLRPDLIISVLPFANPTAWQEAKKRHIPLLIVPTDLGFAHAIKKLTDIDNNLHVALPFSQDSLSLTCEAPLGPGNLVILGYPLRREFVPQADSAAGAQSILSALGIEPGEQLVLFMMGQCGVSGDVMEADARTLLRGLRGRPDKVHGIFFCGSNAHLREHLSEIAAQSDNPDVRLHALPYTPARDVAALMARASVIVTKPGGSTVNEALALKLPILLRRLGTELWWETGNADFVVHNGLGTWTNGGEELIGQVSLALKERPTTLDNCPGRQFAHNLARFVAQVPIAMGNQCTPVAQPSVGLGANGRRRREGLG